MPAVPPVVAPSDTPSDREQIETELIKSLLWSYFQIVRCGFPIHADIWLRSLIHLLPST